MSTQIQERIAVQRPLFTAELTKSVWLSPQTKHLELRVGGVDEFRFTPGQFVSIKQPKLDGKVHTRAYSIASAPRPDASFDLCLNRVEDGFLSNWLCDLEVGATVQFHGPHGLFTLREPRLDAIFIATGTGIAPIRSIVQWLFERPDRNREHEYWLVFGTRREESIYYREEFERIGERESQLSLHTYAQPLRQRLARLPGIRTGPRTRYRSRPFRHASLYLWAASDGGRQPKIAAGRNGLGAQAYYLRTIRLKIT